MQPHGVTCVRNAKKLGVTKIVLEIKLVENYHDFKKIGARNSAWSTNVFFSLFQSLILQ